MFKIKRPVIVGILLVLLIFTGYLNYELTQQALKKTSKNYQKHEDLEKAKYEDEDIAVDKDLNEKDFDIVDSSKEDEEDDVKQVVSSGKESIDKVIGEDKTKTSGSDKNFFVEYRLSRDKLRASVVDRLDDIVKNENTKEDVRSNAQEEIMKIGKNSEKELQIEGLIKSKGYEEVITFLTDEDIKVVVSTNELTEQDMAKILDIVRSETDYDINNIKISRK